jgi:two-component system, chemotaxis family, response regulator WspR
MSLVVLLVDDQPIVAAALRKMLAGESDLTLHYCSDPREAVAKALEIQPTVILQDLLMPDTDGFTLVDSYRAAPGISDVPIIVLSSNEDPRDKSRAFSGGANDYLVKLPDKIELIARIRAHSRMFLVQRQRDEAYRELQAIKKQLEEQNKILEQLSSLDGLTGIANRRSFDTVIDREWRLAQRHQNPIALLLVDVDHFKLYNDHYGHQRGDECLRQIAASLRDGAQRPTDLAARYGGEEFAVLLPHTDGPGAAAVAEQLRQRVEALGLQHERSATAGHVTISVGAAACQPQVNQGPELLIAAADESLYNAKKAGRNRVWSRP